MRAWAEEGPGRGSSNGLQRLRAAEDEDLSGFPAVTAVDPGGTTGICTVWFSREGLLNPQLSLQKCLLAWEADGLVGTENYQTLQILRWLSSRTYGPMALAMEDFVPQQLLKSREFLSPVRIAARVDYQVWRGIKVAGGTGRRTFDLSWQSANDAKNVVTDPRLKAMAMYTPGPDHARDATRHAVLWIRKYRAKLLSGAISV